MRRRRARRCSAPRASPTRRARRRRSPAAAARGSAKTRMIAIVGHFPGTGAASADPDQMQATVGGTLESLKGRDLLPFAAIAGAVPVIEMSNAVYAAFDGVT